MQSTINSELIGAIRSKASRQKQTSKQISAAKPAKTKVGPDQNKSTKKAVSTAIARRTSKQDLVLSMLSQKGGTTITDIMAKTHWQTHTVRGFFAGTVKKKLGFTLTSSKAAGDVRRYRVETRRSR